MIDISRFVDGFVGMLFWHSNAHYCCSNADWVGWTCFQGFECDLFYIVESGEFEATFSQVFKQPSCVCVRK